MKKIEEFISIFTGQKINGIVKEGKEYFLSNEELEDFRKKISRPVFSIGIYLGRDKKGFQPSPALLEMIAKHSKRKAVINPKAEWLFLCGRDVFGKNIEKTKVEEGLVLVQNERDENLGYGELVKKDRQVTLRNKMDRGFYLRRER